MITCSVRSCPNVIQAWRMGRSQRTRFARVSGGVEVIFLQLGPRDEVLVVLRVTVDGPLAQDDQISLGVRPSGFRLGVDAVVLLVTSAPHQVVQGPQLVDLLQEQDVRVDPTEHRPEDLHPHLPEVLVRVVQVLDVEARDYKIPRCHVLSPANERNRSPPMETRE